ncbi:Clp protease N-terminal domain-containing protein [Catenuloplanes indicus]|uniref:ATP-dependent Clp protease ATP-binding subunit ClpA n=1 Tax=Catenuloplanes indicus TaxID=137267 RepID=A0AAE4B243_9ACTN|nr:Clp protease N-terminal domain-containing protein [Catenuloplanes indicus]MDQ0370261.1 ATP-dependent Clp protease ATP-binding subunit ClpA [Catenuloplanes indicus]
MFERFTAEARAVVVQAQAEARELGHTRIGTEHVLLALLGADAGEAGYVLRGAGLDRDDVRARIQALLDKPALGPEDAAALRAIGIDLDAVLARMDETFGMQPVEPQPEPGRRWWQLPKGGHIPFSSHAKKTLELALREALALRSRELRPEHILLGLLREKQGLGARVLADAGLDLEVLRQDVLATLPKAA